MKKTLLVGSCCFLLVGGGLKPVSVSAETPLIVAQNNNASQQTAPVIRSQVELISPGAEPRQELRFKPAVNAKQAMTVKTNMDMKSSISGKSMPSYKIPQSVMKVESVVTQIEPNGDIHYKFSYTDADVVSDSTVPPELFKAMQSSVKQMVGMNGSFISDNRGQIKSGKFNLPEGTTNPMTKQLFDQVSNSFDQFSSPLPQEAVGKGAKWRTSSKLSLSGINLTQNVIYELVDLKDNVATLNVSLEQQANSQQLNLPGMPSGANLALKSLSSKGQGQVLMRLDSMMPVRSNISMNSNNEMSIKEPKSGEEIIVGTQLSMQMMLESLQPK
ncbi:MAG: hypothetical protein U7123_16840 [Potamolinea sp.]